MRSESPHIITVLTRALESFTNRFQSPTKIIKLASHGWLALLDSIYAYPQELDWWIWWIEVVVRLGQDEVAIGVVFDRALEVPGSFTERIGASGALILAGMTWRGIWLAQESAILNQKKCTLPTLPIYHFQYHLCCQLESEPIEPIFCVIVHHGWVIPQWTNEKFQLATTTDAHLANWTVVYPEQ